MKRLGLGILIGMLLVVGGAFAQELGYGVHGGIGFAMYDSYEVNAAGNLEETTAFDPGILLGGTVSYPLNDEIILKGNLGFAMFFAGSEDYDLGGGATASQDITLRDIYIEGEGNYFFQEKLYGIGGLGIHMYTYEVETTYSGTGFFDGTYTSDYGETKFGITVGGGYVLNENINLEGRFQLVSEISQLKLTAVYFLK